MTDFRALCVELHAAFNTYAVDMKHHDLLERARAALAAEPVPPADGEVAELVAWLREQAEYHSINIGSSRVPRFTRAADLLERLAPQPVPEGLDGLDEDDDDYPFKEADDY